MKKYMVPAVILLISIVYLNYLTEPPKQEKKAVSETKPELLPSITTNNGSKELILLEETGVAPQNISTKKLKKAWLEAEAIPVQPWEQLSITYPIYPDRVTFTEYKDSQGIFGYQDEGGIYTATSEPGVMGLIISAEWVLGGKATYFAKLDVQKEYSYQELINPNRGVYTVLSFSEPGAVPDIPKSEDGVYTVKSVSGKKEDLLTDYPELGLGSLPQYFVFNTTQLVYKTLNIKELTAFLTEEEQFVYNGESGNWKITVAVNQKISSTTLETSIAYKGTDGSQIGKYEAMLNGGSWSVGEGSLILNEKNETHTITAISWPVVKGEDLNVIIKINGLEETKIPMKLNSN